MHRKAHIISLYLGLFVLAVFSQLFLMCAGFESSLNLGDLPLFQQTVFSVEQDLAQSAVEIIRTVINHLF